AELRGARPRPRQVPRRPHRLPLVLARRDRDGLRVPEGVARRARRVGAGEVLAAERLRHALPLGARAARGGRPRRGARPRRGRGGVPRPEARRRGVRGGPRLRLRRVTSVAIVGGGIGGLAAALSLLDAGFDVHVYEQAAELGEVGAGIQVSPNASRVLHGLGLADELAATGVRPVAWHQRRWDDGRTLLRTPIGDTVLEAFGFPHYQMHRADLLAALLRAIEPRRVHVGRRLVGLAERDGRVEAEFANGTCVEADLLIGADGIHSTVREVVFGPESARFTGCV